MSSRRVGLRVSSCNKFMLQQNELLLLALFSQLILNLMHSDRVNGTYSHLDRSCWLYCLPDV